MRTFGWRIALSVLICLAVLPTSHATAAVIGPPSVSTVIPAAGKAAGGTRVTITGSGFRHVRDVKFGTVSGSAIQVLSASKLRVTAPRHQVGLVDVRIVTRVGTSPARQQRDHFYFVPPPSVTAVSPDSGTTSGGTQVTLTGVGFTEGVVVKFGGTTGLVSNLSSSSTLTVITPPHPSGTVDVRVTTEYGTSSASSADRYSYTTSP